MGHATWQAKPTRWSAARIQEDAASKAHGLALTPPTYGMDWVDRASAEARRGPTCRGRERPPSPLNASAAYADARAGACSLCAGG